VSLKVELLTADSSEAESLQCCSCMVCSKSRITRESVEACYDGVTPQSSKHARSVVHNEFFYNVP
jgi:hypothetical protein